MLALFGVLIAPFFIDWEPYKLELERRSSQILGQKVEVRGDVRARLLPLPSITFHDINVGTTADGKPMMTAATLRIDADLAPLMKGDVVIVDMQLSNPKLNVAIDEKGSVDWITRQPDFPFDIQADDIVIENINVLGGEIAINNARTGQFWKVADMDVAVSARSLLGPWRIEGNAAMNGERGRFLVNTGRFQPSGRISSKILLQPDAHPYDVQLDGPLALENGLLTYRGEFVAKPYSVANARVAGVEPRAPTYESLPVRTEGVFEANAERIRVEKFQSRIGNLDDPYTVSGSAVAKLTDGGDFRIVAEGQQIDLDRMEAERQGREVVERNIVPIGERIQTIREIVEQVPTFAGRGTISLYLPAIVAGDTVIREIGVDLKPLARSNGWALSNLDLRLPGRTRLQANGSLYLGKNFGYSGDLLLASQQPSGFAGWLVKDVDDAIRNLSNAGFSSKINVFGGLLQMENLEAILGGSQLKGSLERRVGNVGRPRLIVDLEGNEVNFDTLEAFFGMFAAEGDEARLAGHDVDLTIKSERFTAFGVNAEDVDMRVRTRDGNIDLERIEIARLSGAKISASGALKNALSKPDGSITASITAKNGGALLRLIDRKLGRWPGFQGLRGEARLLNDVEIGLELKSVATAGGAKSDIGVVGKIAGSKVDLKLGLTGKVSELGSLAVTSVLELENQDPAVLLAQMGAPVLPIEVGGPFGVKISLDGQNLAALDTEILAALPGSTLNASGRIGYDEAFDLGSDLNARFTSSDLDPVYLLSGLVPPDFGNRSGLSVSAQTVLAGSTFSLKKIDGNFNGAPFSGALTIDADAEPRPRADGELKLDGLAMETMLGLVIGAPTLEGSLGAWSQNPVRPATFKGFDGTVKLAVDQFHMLLDRPESIGLGRYLTGTLNVRDGDLTLQDARMKWLGGQASGSLILSNTRDSALISGQLKVEDGALEQTMWRFSDLPVVDGRFDLTASIEGAGTSMQRIITSLAGGGLLKIKHGSVPKLNAQAFRPIFTAADKVNDEDIDTATSGIVAGAIHDGAFGFGDVDVAFSIAGGGVRASNVVARASGAKVTSDLKIDLLGGTMNASATLAFDAGKEGVVGAVPEISYDVTGPLVDPTATVNTDMIATFLTMRAHERREREFEAQKADIVERQRLVRFARLYRGRERAQERALRLEQERLKRGQENKVAPKAKDVKPAPKKASPKPKRVRRQASNPAKPVPLTKQPQAGGGQTAGENVEAKPLPPISLVPERGSGGNLPGVFTDIEDILKRPQTGN